MLDEEPRKASPIPVGQPCEYETESSLWLSSLDNERKLLGEWTSKEISG